MPDLSSTHLGIVCPMANEGEDGVRFVTEVLTRCDRVGRVEFLAVLDKVTTDNSLDLLRALERTEPRLLVLWAPENRCVVDAYIRGYREALALGCDYILEIDAGFSHQPEDVPKFLDGIAKGYDAVFGSRFMKGSRVTEPSVKRYIVSRGGTFLTNLFIGTHGTDMTSGFEMFSRPTMEMILRNGLRSRAHFFQTEIKVMCRNLNQVEVPIHYRAPSPRLKGTAVTEAFRNLKVLREQVRSGAI
jgi:dolichol-phosphate mannosyltransferase